MKNKLTKRTLKYMGAKISDDTKLGFSWEILESMIEELHNMATFKPMKKPINFDYFASDLKVFARQAKEDENDSSMANTLNACFATASQIKDLIKQLDNMMQSIEIPEEWIGERNP